MRQEDSPAPTKSASQEPEKEQKVFCVYSFENDGLEFH